MKKRYGWAGTILVVDLTSRSISVCDTQQYARRFLGGRGVGEKIYWDSMDPARGAFDPESPLIIMTGPLAASTAPSGSRWVICGKSPSIYPEHFASACLGGTFGAALKKAGYDGMVVRGRASAYVFLSIRDGKVSIEDACHLRGLTTGQTKKTLQQELGGKTAILTTGPAGEHLVRLATVSTDAGGSGSMGFGAVMGSKRLKAIAVRGTGSVAVADGKRVMDLRKKIRRMTGEGYMNLYGTVNQLPETAFIKKVHCHGCPQGCWRALFRGASGEEGVRKCQAMYLYSMWDRELHGDLTEATFRATYLADEYSLCSMELAGLLIWLQRCIRGGVLTEKDVGLAMDSIGSYEFVEQAVEMITLRQGIGDVLAEGVMRASGVLGQGALEIALDHFTRHGRGLAYGPKIFSTSALIYATEPRPATPQLHEICGPATKWALWHTTQGSYSYVSTAVYRNIARRFWGSPEAADFSTLEGKARAASMIQDRQYAKECLVLCDFAFPLFDDAGTDDHVGDPTLESQLFSAVTGERVDEQQLYRVGARAFNLYRAILLREGRRGRADDVLPASQFVEREEQVLDVFGMFNPDLLLPGKGDDVISRKGRALTREGFETMLSEYYRIRGWDPDTGIPEAGTLQALDLYEVTEATKVKAFS